MPFCFFSSSFHNDIYYTQFISFPLPSIPILPSPSLSAALRNAFVSASVRSLPSLEKPFSTYLRKVQVAAANHCQWIELKWTHDSEKDIYFVQHAVRPAWNPFWVCLWVCVSPSLELFLLYESATVHVQDLEDLLDVFSRHGPHSHHFKELFGIECFCFKRQKKQQKRKEWITVTVFRWIERIETCVDLLWPPVSIAKVWSFVGLSPLRLPRRLHNAYRPAKASRAFLISSAFSRSVIGILSAGGRRGVRETVGDREDTKSTKWEMKERYFKGLNCRW